jgi:hypothetical protein
MDGSTTPDAGFGPSITIRSTVDYADATAIAGPPTNTLHHGFETAHLQRFWRRS